ncbi:MAG: hypothetical protein HRF44_08875 [Ignavibacterium sp.]|jgi:hypothetical protein
MSHWRVKSSEPDFARSDGFALPSVLFLVAILTTLALSLLSFAYLERKIALRELFQLRAEYAAQSGIALVLNDLSGSVIPSLPLERRYDFPDGSTALTNVQPWGLLLAVKSKGISQSITSTRRCLAAQEPATDFEKALILANVNHALVMTGNSRIVGDVVVNHAGVSTGSLRDYTTPFKIPILGNVTKKRVPVLPEYMRDLVSNQLSMFDGFLSRKGLPEFASVVVSTGILNVDEVDDAVQMIISTGHLVVSGSTHRTSPLYIVSEGKVSLERASGLQGLIAVCSKADITVAQDCTFENIILYSRDSITVEPNATGSGQLIAPIVNVSKSTKLHYPSFVLSIPSKESVTQRISLSDTLEGLVIMMTDISASPEDQLTVIESDAVVVGALFSEGSVTLDGRMIGTAAVKDFYFYEAPTQYVGWMRKGAIERDRLPGGFMVPPGMGGTGRLGVLEWM